MPVTKKYKKGRNNRRKTRILLKKKFRRTRKKIVGGAAIESNTLSKNAFFIINVDQIAQGLTKSLGGLTKNLGGITKNNYTYLLIKNYEEMGPTIICIKQHLNTQTNSMIGKDKIHIEPLFTMDKTDIEFNDDQLVLNLPTWKKVTLTNGTIIKEETAEANANETDLQKFSYKIKELIYDENSDENSGNIIEYDTKSVYSMIKKSGTSGTSDTDKDSSEYKIATTLATASGGVAAAAAALNSIVDSANIPLIAIVTGSISVLSGAIATKIREVHENQKEINKVLLEIKERIKQLWKYIIKPLERINKMEEKVTTHSTAATDSSSATGAPGASASYSTDTNLQKILILILNLMHQNNIYKKRMDKLNEGKLNLRLKALLNTHTKEKLKYLSSELEKEILLLIQIINLKTNSNTLELLEKTEIQEYLLKEKQATESKMQSSSEWTEGVIQAELRRLKEENKKLRERSPDKT